MFSTGQWMFAGFFVLAFTAAMFYAYTKDKMLHKKYYRRSYIVLIGFLTFIAILLIIKFGL